MNLKVYDENNNIFSTCKAFEIRGKDIILTFVSEDIKDLFYFYKLMNKSKKDSIVKFMVEIDGEQEYFTCSIDSIKSVVNECQSLYTFEVFFEDVSR